MMSNKEKLNEAMSFFLNKYGFLLNFHDDSYKKFKKRISHDESDTFKKWKEKTFGNGDAKITLLGEIELANNTKFKNIKSYYKAATFISLMKKFELDIELDCQEKEVKKVSMLKKKFKKQIETQKRNMEYFPKEILESCVSEYLDSDELEQSVEEFFKRWLESDNDRIELGELLLKLISAYNSSVKEYRKLLKNTKKNMSKLIFAREEF